MHYSQVDLDGVAAPREGDIAWKRGFVKKAFGSDFAYVFLISLSKLVVASARRQNVCKRVA